MILKKLLVRDKSTAYKVNNDGMTALHIAAFCSGNVEIIEEIINSCPGCCEVVDKKGWNVLHFAAASQNRKAIDYLVENPLLRNIINEKDEKGRTPFLRALAVQIVIDHPGVDTMVFDNQNRNGIDITWWKPSIWKSFVRYSYILHNIT